PDELLEALEIGGGQLIRIFGTNGTALAASTALPAERLTGQRHARIVGDDEDVDLLGERQPEVFGEDADEREAVLLEDPARPAFVHRARPRLKQAEARFADGAPGR